MSHAYAAQRGEKSGKMAGDMSGGGGGSGVLSGHVVEFANEGEREDLMITDCVMSCAGVTIRRGGGGKAD